jgi:hypothetical protein
MSPSLLDRIERAFEISDHLGLRLRRLFSAGIFGPVMLDR